MARKAVKKQNGNSAPIAHEARLRQSDIIVANASFNICERGSGQRPNGGKRCEYGWLLARKVETPKVTAA